MKQVGNRIIFSQNGNIIFQTGEIETNMIDYDREEIQTLDYIDLEYGVINYNTHYIESIDVSTKQPVIKEYPEPELTEEQKYIKELEEQLAWAQSQIVSTIPEL